MAGRGRLRHGVCEAQLTHTKHNTFTLSDTHMHAPANRKCLSENKYMAEPIKCEVWAGRSS